MSREYKKKSAGETALFGCFFKPPQPNTDEPALAQNSDSSFEVSEMKNLPFVRALQQQRERTTTRRKFEGIHYIFSNNNHCLLYTYPASREACFRISLLM